MVLKIVWSLAMSFTRKCERKGFRKVVLKDCRSKTMNLVARKYERKEMFQESGRKNCVVLGLEFIYKDV